MHKLPPPRAPLPPPRSLPRRSLLRRSRRRRRPSRAAAVPGRCQGRLRRPEHGRDDEQGGQAAGVKIKDLQAKRTAELEGKQKQLQAAQQKLEQGGAVLSESARAQQAKEVERLQTELQRSSQDAQKEIQEFTQELQVQFQQKLLPIIEQVAKAKNLHFILSIADAGVVWVDAGLNVTADVVTALDAATPAAK